MTILSKFSGESIQTFGFMKKKNNNNKNQGPLIPLIPFMYYRLYDASILRRQYKCQNNKLVRKSQKFFKQNIKIYIYIYYKTAHFRISELLI